MEQRAQESGFRGMEDGSSLKNIEVYIQGEGLSRQIYTAMSQRGSQCRLYKEGNRSNEHARGDARGRWNDFD